MTELGAPVSVKAIGSSYMSTWVLFCNLETGGGMHMCGDDICSVTSPLSSTPPSFEVVGGRHSDLEMGNSLSMHLWASSLIWRWVSHCGSSAGSSFQSMCTVSNEHYNADCCMERSQWFLIATAPRVKSSYMSMDTAMKVRRCFTLITKPFTMLHVLVMVAP